MDFGSEYILDKEEEEEEMPVPVQHRSQRQMPPSYAMDDSGGFECEIMEFADEEEENLQTQQKAAKPKNVDTNTVNLTMESLTKDSDKTLHMSQKLNCQGDKCGAIFSHLTKVEQKDGKKIWKCPFCDAENEATGDLQNLTYQETDVMYVEDINKLPNMSPPKDKNDYSIIFVVDTSASMCQTSEIPREGASKYLTSLYDQSMLLQQQFLAQLSPDDSMRQNMIQQKTDKLDVTRLMLVKDAVISVLEDLKSKKPKVRVGLVVFNEKVMVLGDGSSKVEVENDKLMDKIHLKMIGQQHSELRPISESADDLKKEITCLHEEGRTALGPALLIAEKMASSKGSKVILLTDGCANIGLGKLEESTETDIAEFYDNLIMTCKIDGVSVSVISCDEAELKSKLGDIPDETGGIVKKINAKDYRDLLLKELERQAAATDGLLNFVVGKNMYVKLKDDSIKNSRFTKLTGNINLEKKIPLGFAMQQSADPQQQQSTSAATPNATVVSAPAPTPAPAVCSPANAPAPMPAPMADPPTSASPAVNGTVPPTSSGRTSPSTSTTDGTSVDDGHVQKKVADDAANAPAPTPAPVADPPTSASPAVNGTVPPTSSERTSPSTSTSTGTSVDDGHVQKKVADDAVKDHSDGGEANTAAQPQQQPQAEADGIQCPFQVQIKYTDMYGTVAWRVWTKQKKLTKSRQQAEDGMNTKSAVTSFMQTAAGNVIDAKDTERTELVQKLTDACKEWQNKFKPDDDENSLKKLIEFQNLLTEVAQKTKLDDDMSTKLRAFKEDRSVSAKA